MKLKSVTTKPSRNSGSMSNMLYIARKNDFDTIAIPVDTRALARTGNYQSFADEASRDTAITSPANEVIFLENHGIFQKYDSNLNEWVRVSNVIINDDHTFSGNNGFYRLRVTKDKINQEVEGPSESDVTGKNFKPTFSIPGWTPDNFELEQLLAEDEFIILWPTRDGQIVQFGDFHEGVDIQATDMPMGENSQSFKGVTYTVDYNANNLVFYKGAITLNS